MAHLHCKRTVYKSGGATASQRLAYITRQPAQGLSVSERQVRYISHAGREDLVYANSRNLPGWAHDNPHVYFKAAEQYEGANRVAFEEWKITLPHELTHRENMALTRDVVEAIAGDRLPCTYAFHDPPTLRETRQQPHLHLLLSTRQNDAHSRSPEQHFMRFNRAHPDRGGAEKDPAFQHLGAVKAHRVLITDVINLHLERAGHEMRIHPDRLQDRGIDRAPEPKLWPSESRQYREQGMISERMQQVLRIRGMRGETLAEEFTNARQYWEGRKIELGLTRDQTPAQQLDRITQARELRIQHAPEHPTLTQLQEHEQTLTRRVEGLQHYAWQVQQVRAAEAQWVSRQGRAGWEAMLEHERVLAEGKDHGLPRDGEAEKMVGQLTRLLAGMRDEESPQVGPPLKMKLHERDHGLGW